MYLCLRCLGAVLKRGVVRELMWSIHDCVVDHGQGVVAPVTCAEPCLML